MDSHGGNIYRIARETGCRPGDLIDFSSNINPLGAPASLKKAIKDKLDTVKNYPDPDYYDLKNALSDYHNIDINKIIPGNGATELIFLFMRALSPERALVVSPTFSEYITALASVGTQIDYFELKEESGFQLDTDALMKHLQKKYGLLVLCNPNNPTGTFTDKNTIEEIINCAVDNNTFVMIDESFIEFIPQSSEKTSMFLGEKRTDLLVLRSLTKFFGIPGLRIGYAACFNETIASTMKKMQEPWSINVFADMAGQILLNDKKYINKTIKLIEREKRWLREELKKIEWLKVYESETNFFLLKIQNNMKAAELASGLLEKKILIRNASNFKFLDSKFVRLAVKDRKSNKHLIKCLNEIV